MIWRAGGADNGCDKERLLNYSDLVERYFSLNRYNQMLKDIKDYKSKFNINPSFEILREIIENIDLSKLDTDDLGFILLNFFGQYQYFETKNDYYDDFDNKIIRNKFAVQFFVGSSVIKIPAWVFAKR